MTNDKNMTPRDNPQMDYSYSTNKIYLLHNYPKTFVQLCSHNLKPNYSLYELKQKQELENFIHIYKQTASMEPDKMRNNNGIYLECSRCSKRWLYKGSNPYYATCSFCKNSVNIRKNIARANNYASQACGQPEQIERGDQS